MIESRNSMGMLDPAFLYTRECFQSFHFSFGYAKIPKKSVYSCFLILFENSFDGLKAGIS